MATILRQIVAGPRARHPEAGLDLCYVTDNIVVTSGPSSVWPKKAYRNPTDQLVGFLDRKHEKDWSIFEFRAEGTGYPDAEVYNRIHHFPWPDHHPPPFEIIPNLMAAMRNWIKRLDDDTAGEGRKDRIAVVHCKAGKGRSGTATCSYLISEEGWKREDALQRFTQRRMRVGFGDGVSIPSQLRWVRYVDQWTNELSKKYTERAIEITEVHVWGLREGVKVVVEGFVEDGRRIHNFHTFTREEKTVVEEGKGSSKPQDVKADDGTSSGEKSDDRIVGPAATSSFGISRTTSWSTQTVILRPSSKVILPTSDVNIDFERRNKAAYTGFTMVTSLAHVWFNAWFEGGCHGEDSGVFEIDWEAMDGIKGSSRKGIKALEKLKVVWKYVKDGENGAPPARVVEEPKEGAPVPEGKPADWKGEDPEHEAEARHADGLTSGRTGGAALTVGATISQGASTLSKELGLRKENPESTNISRASSPGPPEHHNDPHKTGELQQAESSAHEGIRSHGPAGEEYVHYDSGHEEREGVEGRQDTVVGRTIESGMEKISSLVAKIRGTEAVDATASDNTHSKKAPPRDGSKG